jgi:hypothetical protein
MGLLPKAPVKPEAFYICSKAQQLFGQYVVSEALQHYRTST